MPKASKSKSSKAKSKATTAKKAGVGMHRMSSGMMMSDAAMAKMMGKKG